VARHQASDPAFASRVRESFARQGLMRAIGATLARVAPGEVEIALTVRRDLTQQHGLLHAGAMTAIADSACGYAALSLMPPGTGVLTVEFKVNLLAPGKGVGVVAHARVLRAGRTLTVCAGDVFAIDGGEETLVLTMLATEMTVRDRPGVVD
jgi:uncharacterized protein (TIGR00369 family)